MTDEPMFEQQMYNKWIANRRTAEPSHDLTDRVMVSLGDRVKRKRYVRLAYRINESHPARLAACLTAFLVGSLPFMFVAYVAQSLVF